MIFLNKKYSAHPIYFSDFFIIIISYPHLPVHDVLRL
jgi:hypothetical protein